MLREGGGSFEKLLTKEGRDRIGTEDASNVPASLKAKRAFSYQKMPVSYQKQHFSYHLPSRGRAFCASFLGSCARSPFECCGVPALPAPHPRQARPR